MAGESILQQLAQIMVPERNFRPDGYGSIPNYEAVIYGTRANSGIITPVPVNTIIVDTPTVFPMGRPKSIAIVTSGTITFTSGTPTAQLYSKRTPQAAAFTGAATSFPLADGNLVGTAQPLLAAPGTTLPNTLFLLTPSEIAQLQWDTGHIGIELKFPAAPTQGSLYVVCWMSPN